MENQQYLQEDEIDIREYVNVIMKRKKLILSIFFTAVVITAIMSLLMPKIYEITSTIQLGSVNELLIKKEEVKEIILNQNSLLAIINQLGLKTEVERFRKEIKIDNINDTDLLSISITYPGIDTALKINDAIVNPLIAQGQSIYQERLALANERLKELEAEIKNAEVDIIRTQTLISGLPNSGNISQADVSLRIILLQNTLPNYESNLTALRNQKNELKLLINNAKDFKIFDAPIRPLKPIAPKKAENVFIAGIISLVFGIFLAFFMEFYRKVKSKNF